MVRSKHKELLNKLNQEKGKRELLIKQQQIAEENKVHFEKRYASASKALSLIQSIARTTQKRLEQHFSNLVTLALASVFPDPYKFELRFVERRNKTEADFVFIKNGKETDDILSSGGGGVADIASFALRVATWGLKKTRAVFLLDEPFKFLHNPMYQEKASEFMNMLCEKKRIQIITISDQENLIKAADNVINIQNNNGVSEVQ
jgi:hypothetical protein